MDIEKNVNEVKNSVSVIEFKVNSLNTTLANVKLQADNNEQKISVINYKLEEMEQYSRRPNLRFFGLPEEKGENTDNILLSVIKDVMKINIKLSDIRKKPPC